MKIAVKTLAGKAAGDVDLDDAVFGLDPRADLLHRVVRWQLAKRRAGTHDTLERGEVARTKTKWGRQKGGGRARHGARTAGIFRGGAKAHAPKPRDYAFSLPKKVRALALRHALSSRAKTDALTVLDDAKLDAPKTSALAAALGKLKLENALIIGGAEFDENFARAARNLPRIDVLPVQGLNVYDVLAHDNLVLTKAAVDALHARFAEKAGAKAKEAA
ncbi:MAG: 50S ribosomal protein L4 [Maricaulaceae bacterium]|jgi:large subunit ribosomal protein L4